MQNRYRTDDFVTPYTNGFIRSTGPNVRNQILQDWCPNDMSGHPFVQLNRKFRGVKECNCLRLVSANVDFCCLTI